MSAIGKIGILVYLLLLNGCLYYDPATEPYIVDINGVKITVPIGRKGKISGSIRGLDHLTQEKTKIFAQAHDAIIRDIAPMSFRIDREQAKQRFAGLDIDYPDRQSPQYGRQGSQFLLSIEDWFITTEVILCQAYFGYDGLDGHPADEVMIFKLAFVNSEAGWQLQEAKRQLPDIVYHF